VNIDPAIGLLIAFSIVLVVAVVVMRSIQRNQEYMALISRTETHLATAQTELSGRLQQLQSGIHKRLDGLSK